MLMVVRLFVNLVGNVDGLEGCGVVDVYIVGIDYMICVFDFVV